MDIKKNKWVLDAAQWISEISPCWKTHENELKKSNLVNWTTMPVITRDLGVSYSLTSSLVFIWKDGTLANKLLDSSGYDTDFLRVYYHRKPINNPMKTPLEKITEFRTISLGEHRGHLTFIPITKNNPNKSGEPFEYEHSKMAPKVTHSASIDNIPKFWTLRKSEYFKFLMEDDLEECSLTIDTDLDFGGFIALHTESRRNKYYIAKNVDLPEGFCSKDDRDYNFSFIKRGTLAFTPEEVGFAFESYTDTSKDPGEIQQTKSVLAFKKGDKYLVHVKRDKSIVK